MNRQFPSSVVKLAHYISAAAALPDRPFLTVIVSGQENKILGLTAFELFYSGLPSLEDHIGITADLSPDGIRHSEVLAGGTLVANNAGQIKRGGGHRPCRLLPPPARLSGPRNHHTLYRCR